MEKKPNILMNTIQDDPSMQPLIEAIEEIMEMPEEELTDGLVDVFTGMIRGAFTESIVDETVNSLIERFNTEGLTRAKAAETIQLAKQAIQDAIDSLTPSPNKRKLLEAIFKSAYDIYDIALERYHTYDIELPVKLDEGAQVPTYAHDTDACADLYASQDMIIPAHSLSNMVHTGLRIALPENWVFMLDTRSSIGFKTGLRLSNSIGIIDEDYRGEIGVLFDNLSDSDFEIKAGDRIAQGWVQPVYRFKPVPVDELPTTERGEGGFGSTGK